MSESTAQPRTIALCITELDVGGAERALATLATGLDRDRFRPIVYCLGPRPDAHPSFGASPPSGAPASLVPRLESAGVEVHCLGARGAGDTIRTLGKLTALFRAHRPALVQTFLFHANLLGRLAARRARVGRVVCGIRVAERRKRWHLWLDRLTHRMVDRYVCVSNSVREFSATAGRLPAAKLTVIPNGVDGAGTAAAVPADLAALGVPQGASTLVSVGRLDFQKGLDWLLETCPQWLPDAKDWHLLLVGAGPEQRRLRAQAAASGFGDRIHMAGWRGDVAEILAASQLLLLPSRWEGMPNVLLQAMAAGLPVLATEVEGVAELLGPDAPAQTVPFGDTPGWSVKLRQLLADGPLRRHIGERNRARAAAEFAVGPMLQRYQSLWSELLEDG